MADSNDIRGMRKLITWDDDLYSMSFDALMVERFHRAATITEYPVESGAIISDHSQPGQVELELEVHVSDTPVTIPPDFMDSGVTGNREGNSPLFQQELANAPEYRKAGLGPALPSGRLVRNLAYDLRGRDIDSPTVLVFEGGKLNRVANIYQQLNTFLEEATLLKVHSHLRHFDNMVLKDIETAKHSRDGSGRIFRLNLVQLSIVQLGGVISGGIRLRRRARRKEDEEKKDGGGEEKKLDPTERESVWSQGVEGKITGYWHEGDTAGDAVERATGGN